MLDWTYLGSALGLTVGFTVTVALLIRTPLFAVLQYVCGTDIGARFWTRYAMIMIVVGPLFLVAAFVGEPADLIHFLRSTLAMTASGLIGAFVIMGLAINQWIAPKPSAQRPSDAFAAAAE